MTDTLHPSRSSLVSVGPPSRSEQADETVQTTIPVQTAIKVQTENTETGNKSNLVSWLHLGWLSVAIASSMPGWLRRYARSRPSMAATTPAFLVSLIFHVGLLLLLAMLTLTTQGGLLRSFDFTAATTPFDTPTTNAELVLASGDAPPPPAATSEPNIQAPSPSAANTASQISELLSERAPDQTEPSNSSLVNLLNATSDSTTASFAATGVAGRQLQQRREIAMAHGGTLESEAAVERALEWLAAHQLPSGGWSLVHDGGKCQGNCPDNGSPERFDPAATGLSLLAFLGAGYTHREGKHRETVRRGIYFLQQIMEETPLGGSFLHQNERGMYNHGIAAFAICEAFQMTADKDLRPTAQAAIDFIVSAQSYQGGWGYLPKQPGDLTLSGWQIMALKSGFAAGLEVPAGTILRIDPFLDTQQLKSSCFYGYRKPDKHPTCTAIGLLLRLFRGMPHTHPTMLDGAVFVSRQNRPGNDAYFNYYSTLLLFHIGQPFWAPWNEQMREHLIQTQSQSGHTAGSWYFDDPYGREGGRLYTTAMCAMTLEVYYRFAPIYQQTDIRFEL